MGSILWTIIIGFVAGVIAKLIMPGNKYEPSGFVMTTILGIIGAFVATLIGQKFLGWDANEGANLFGSIIGAIIILAIYGFVAKRAGNNAI